MKTISVSCAALLLQGCFFVWIPGSVVGGVTDAVTGAEGKHCVSRLAKVGGKIKMSDGSVGTIKSLSGESSRCQDANIPIRALVEFPA